MARDVLQIFADWAHGRPGIEPDVVQTLVDLKANDLDDPQPGRWRSGDLGELLLDVVPRKVTADDEWYASVVPTMHAFLTRLHSTGQLHRGSAPLSTLLAELDDVAGEFLDAVHDSSRFGMAGSLLGAGEDDDLDDEDDFYDDLDDDDEDDEDDDDLPAALPAVRLAPTLELAAAARAAVTIRVLGQLDEWLGAGRAVTSTGVLTLEEARSLQAALGWTEAAPTDTAGDSVDHAPTQAVRSARDLPRLHVLWMVATETGVVELQRTRAHAGPARPTLRGLQEVSPRADDQVLDLWQEAFDATLRIVPDVGWAGFDEDDVAEAVLDALVAAYENDDHTVGQVLEELFDEQPTQGPPHLRKLTRSVIRRHVVDEFTRLADLGAVTQVIEDDDLVSLTPLGVHGLRTFILARGGEAPVVEDVTDLPTDRAAAQILVATPELARELALEWLAPRERTGALRELATVLRDFPAAERRQLLTMFMTIDHVPNALAELCAGDPLLGPLVRASLAEADVVRDLRLEGLDGPDGVDERTVAAMLSVVHGLAWRDTELPPAERDVLVVDALARAVLGLEAPVYADDVDPEYWSLLDESTVLRMQGSVHPEADRVLAAIATGHPTGRLRKAAKKVQHKRATAPV